MEFVALIIPSFFAGLLTFLAPCTLPLVPAYLGFVGGVSSEDLQNPETAKRAKAKVFFNGLFFVIGFSLVFIIFGTLAGFVGGALLPFRIWLSRIGGVFVILFGLFMLNVVRIPFLSSEKRINPPKFFKRGKPTNSLMLGFAFGFGWTPCVGPILGSILLLASTSATAFQGAILLSVFSAGLAIPFLLIALGIGSASQHLQRFSKYLNAISVIGGLVLTALGVLLLTNNVALLLSYGFRFLEFLNYDALLNYL